MSLDVTSYYTVQILSRPGGLALLGTHGPPQLSGRVQTVPTLQCHGATDGPSISGSSCNGFSATGCPLGLLLCVYIGLQSCMLICGGWLSTVVDGTVVDGSGWVVVVSNGVE